MKMYTMILKKKHKKKLRLTYDIMKLYGLCNNVHVEEEAYNVIKNKVEAQKNYKGKQLKLENYFDITSKEMEAKVETVEEQETE